MGRRPALGPGAGPAPHGGSSGGLQGWLSSGAGPRRSRGSSGARPMGPPPAPDFRPPPPRLWPPRPAFPRELPARSRPSALGGRLLPERRPWSLDAASSSCALPLASLHGSGGPRLRGCLVSSRPCFSRALACCLSWSIFHWSPISSSLLRISRWMDSSLLSRCGRNTSIASGRPSTQKWRRCSAKSVFKGAPFMARSAPLTASFQTPAALRRELMSSPPRPKKADTMLSG
mmetsp:Transcript_111878/g.327139  ORF Transcript_111878/g.327139 Transcript_111878/m.327139 type:complete len:231 (-) Transcript_111878:434-1126(-)